MIPVTAHSSPDDETIARAAAFVASQRTLEDVVRDVLCSGGALLDVVVQDEFTHDVVVRWVDAGTPRILVYDTT